MALQVGEGQDKVASRFGVLAVRACTAVIEAAFGPLLPLPAPPAALPTRQCVGHDGHRRVIQHGGRPHCMSRAQSRQTALQASRSAGPGARCTMLAGALGRGGVGGGGGWRRGRPTPRELRGSSDTLHRTRSPVGQLPTARAPPQTATLGGGRRVPPRQACPTLGARAATSRGPQNEMMAPFPARAPGGGLAQAAAVATLSARRRVGDLTSTPSIALVGL